MVRAGCPNNCLLANSSMKLVTCLPILLVMVSVGKGHMVSKRQAEQQSQPPGGSFHLFGQILGGLARLFGTVVEEGGNFLARQAEVNQPVAETVANISSTIGQSEFVRGVQGNFLARQAEVNQPVVETVANIS